MISHLKPRSLRFPVYSPILERYYEQDEVLTERLAEHLVRPVKFMSAVQHLHAEGVQIYVESGALDTLCKIVKKVLKEAEPVTVACLNPKVGDQKAMTNALNTLNTYNALAGTQAESSLSQLLPGIAPDTFAAFWTAYGSQVQAYAQEEFELFLRQQSASQVAAMPSIVTLSTSSKMSRETLFKELTAMYAAALEYPEEVFTEEVELEAELGIDSVKQTELLARVGERYHLPERPANFRLSDYDTMGKLVDFVYEMQGAISSSAEMPQPASAPVVMATALPAVIASVTSSQMSRDLLFKELSAMYAAALEYPEEVFTEEVELEAELGIDSVKQTELLARVGERYHLPERPANFRMSDYDTMGKLVDFVYEMQGREAETLAGVN